MRIIIAGAGEVGSHLARLLSNEDQDILLIDKDQERVAALDASCNIMTLVANPVSFDALREAGAARCDLFIAVTPYEAKNIVACSIAKRLGAAVTVARIDHYGYMDSRNDSAIRDMGIDRLIYPEYLAAQEIISALRHTWVRHWFELHGGQIILVGVRLRQGAPLAGMQLKEFATVNNHFHVAAIKRNNETIIPRGDDRMDVGDILYITSTRQHVGELVKLCGKTPHRVRRVIVMGGGKIAIRLANMAGSDYRITIIDNDFDTCSRLPNKCPGVDIVHGDARDTDTLLDAGIADADAFVALSPSSESNILTCLTAKELGVKKTVAEVESLQFISQAEGLNIGTIINKKLLASSTIFQLLLDADSSTSKCLALADAEVAELEVRPGARITRDAVRNLNLSRELTLAGLIRDGQGMMITGNTTIVPGDRVLVFCLAGALHKVEKLFG